MVRYYVSRWDCSSFYVWVGEDGRVVDDGRTIGDLRDEGFSVTATGAE